MFQARRKATAVMVAAMLLAAMPSTGARSQSATAEIDALNRKVLQLHKEGKYAEAAAAAEKGLALCERLLGKDDPKTLTAVNNLAAMYNALGRAHDAEPLYQRAVEGRQRVLGNEHADTLASVNNLATLHFARGRYVEAEPLFKRTLEISRRVLGDEHANTIGAANNLATLYTQMGRHAEAATLHRQTLEVNERVLGKEHPNTLRGMNNLAAVYYEQGRYRDAETLLERVLAGYERISGKEHPDTLRSFNNLAFLYMAQARYSDAEPLYLRSLQGHDQLLGKEHPITLQVVDNLANLYSAQGRAGDAEPLYKRAVEMRDRVLGKEHPDTLQSLNNLALLYQDQGRSAEAEPLLKLVLEASERRRGEDHADTLTSVNNLAVLYAKQKHYKEAEALYLRAVGTRERTLGPDHPATLRGVHNLAALYEDQQRYGEAEALFKRALAGSERVLGPEHPETLTSISNLGGLYQTVGRYGESEPLLKRVIEIRERVLSLDHPDTLGSYNNLAVLRLVQSDWEGAARLWRRSTAGIIQRTRRGALVPGQRARGKSRSEAEQLAWQFSGLVKVIYRTGTQAGAPDSATLGETFETAQWALSSEAAQSIAQMAARSAKGDRTLAALVRERQDLLADWQKRDTRRDMLLGLTVENRDAAMEAENTAGLAAIDARLAEIDRKLAAEFPNYAALASPEPLSVKETQAQLGPDEALILFLDTDDRFNRAMPEETFIWVVTRETARWFRSGLGAGALAREARALRCGLDAAQWAESAGQAASGCAGLVSTPYGWDDVQAGKPLPFDHTRAHALYKALFGEAKDLIRGKHLLLVPSGPLTQLPFQVLITEPPAPGVDHRSAAWLVRSHAISVLPAVSSLKALRRIAHPSAATMPMIGFGNPLLDGNQADPWFGAEYKKLAQSARDRQRCSPSAANRVAELRGLRGVRSATAQDALARPIDIRVQSPLPETADELCAVARDLGAAPDDIQLGAAATERNVKALSSSGRLAQYRVVHFATHGALAGELNRISEPGLLLTPPDAASSEDDGFLSATEIAGLRLDADWVILSACNTAAGGAASAEALSGLARAFIYAQARALLVSHWAVDSGATVKLITAAVGEMAAGGKPHRAEAFRRATLALIDRGEAREAHPAYWAPFVVVGEGAR